MGIQIEEIRGWTARFKARLVAQGFSQKYGADYNEVFAPVVKHTTFRVLLSIAGQRGYKVRHLDAKTAFLNGKLNEEIYMRQPPGYEEAGKENYACKLIRSIYGLKQAAKAWNDRLNEVLSQQEFVRSNNDYCLYTKQRRNHTVYVAVYVDDIIIACRSSDMIEEVKINLNNQFCITDLGDLICYLGIQIRRNEEGDFFINQSEYIKKVLENMRISDSKGSTTPIQVT